MKKKFYKELLEYNEPLFQYKKLAEELAELLLVCLQKQNKKEDHHPPLSKFIEEISHVKLRMKALIIQEGIKKEVNESLKEKAEKLLGWKAEGKYKGGL